MDFGPPTTTPRGMIWGFAMMIFVALGMSTSSFVLWYAGADRIPQKDEVMLLTAGHVLMVASISLAWLCKKREWGGEEVAWSVFSIPAAYILGIAGGLVLQIKF